jgi:hypothetical protein
MGYTLIASNVLSAATSSVTFSSIPQTYTDLIVKHSARTSGASDISTYLQFNGDTGSNYAYRTGYSDYAAGTPYGVANASGLTSAFAGMHSWDTQTANTFGASEIQICNYTSSASKQYLAWGVAETNGSATYQSLNLNTWSGTSAINSVRIFATPSSGNFVVGSTFYIYGRI